jgi:hypothetical protein
MPKVLAQQNHGNKKGVSFSPLIIPQIVQHCCGDTKKWIDLKPSIKSLLE